jgi:hypothetical protein
VLPLERRARFHVFNREVEVLGGVIDRERLAHWELDRVFPKAADLNLIQGMKLDERYKDVTFETLNREDLLESVKEAFPNVDWEKAYKEFKAAAGGKRKQGPSVEVALLDCCDMAK